MQQLKSSIYCQVREALCDYTLQVTNWWILWLFPSGVSIWILTWEQWSFSTVQHRPKQIPTKLVKTQRQEGSTQCNSLWTSELGICQWTHQLPCVAAGENLRDCSGCSNDIYCWDRITRVRFCSENVHWGLGWISESNMYMQFLHPNPNLDLKITGTFKLTLSFNL